MDNEAAKNYSIGILAYGSLIDEPGDEIAPLIIQRIPCTTPFPIEYARKSGSRSFGPTLIPVEKGGGSVNAIVLVLSNAVKLPWAEDMLWRRETRQNDFSKGYARKKTYGVNAVQIKTIYQFHGVTNVLYTSIGSNLPVHSPPIIAKLAVESILDEAGELKRDGVRYLDAAIKNGIITPLTEDYIKCILEIAGAGTLDEAIQIFDLQRPAALMRKQEQREFEEHVKIILEHITQYGLRQMPEAANIKPEEYKKFLEENKERFFKNCHTGFKKAQDEILRLMLGFEKQKEKLEDELKILDRKTSREKVVILKNDILDIGNREAILRHLIDTIAWQMLKGQLYLSRRLYSGVKGKKKLFHSNIESVIEAAKRYNEVELDFALITDLSAYIQTGDILLLKDISSLNIVEVKQGSKNREVLMLLDKVVNSEEPFETIFENVKLDKKMIEQLDRNMQQYVDKVKVVQIMNTDKGEDKAGRKVNIITPKEEFTPRFDESFNALEKQLATRRLWAYDVIDECLHIGLSKGEIRFTGADMLEKIGKENNSNYIIMDYRRVINSLYRPVFTMSVSQQLKLDLVFGKVLLFFMVDLDAFLKLFPQYGLTAEWLSEKETAKLLANKKDHQLFLFKHRSIKVTDNESKKSCHLNHGIFGKLYFEHILPSYVAYSCRYLLGLADDPSERDTNSL